MIYIRLLSVFCVLYFCETASAASILALFSSLSFADHSVFRGYVSQLTQRGHSVVLMTPYPGQFQYPDNERIVELDVGGESAPFWNDFKELIQNTDDYFPRQRALNELMLKIAIAQLRAKPIQALFLNPNIQFDLVIAEADVPVLYAVAERYGAPLIAFTTSTGRIHQHEAKGNPIYPSLYLDVNTLKNSNLTSWEKLQELYRLVRTRNEYYYNYLPLSELAAKKILGLRRSLLDVEYDIDLLMIASNPTLAGIRPVVPSVVYADRMHIKAGILTPDLQAKLNGSTKGAVLFSLGAMQDSEGLAPQILQTLTDVFRELPYTVLWRIGNTTGLNLPENVVAMPWFPQQEVLAHPNVKAFITSGGPRSLEEAVYYQVPIVGFPLIKSRKTFMQQITKFNGGEILDPYNLDKDTMKAIIIKVAIDEKYKQSMMKLRDVVVDPAISGPERAVWWTEYVLKHKGAKHLRSPAVGVGFFKFFMVEILLYLNIGIFLSLYLSFLVLRLIVRRIRSRFFGVIESDGKFKML